MTILNSIEHGDLCYQPRHGPDLGDCTNRMPLVVGEFMDAGRDHPILFGTDQDGGVSPIALLGFARGENRHFTGADWGSSYIPASCRRGPFSLTVRRDAAGRETDILVNADLADGRLGAVGEPLFLPHGGQAPVLERVTETLLTLYEGRRTTPAFVDTLLQLELLQPVEIAVDLGEGRTVAIDDHLVVDSKRFAALEGAALVRLNEAGYLVPLVHALSSLANIARLAARRPAA